VLRGFRVEAVWYAGSFTGGGTAGGQAKLTPAEVRILPPPLVYVRLKMARGHRVAEGWHIRKLPSVIRPSRNVELREEAGNLGTSLRGFQRAAKDLRLGTICGGPLEIAPPYIVSAGQLPRRNVWGDPRRLPTLRGNPLLKPPGLSFGTVGPCKSWDSFWRLSFWLWSSLD
jgi:hypothetical protein